MDLLGDNLFENLDITNFEIKDLVNTNPLIAKALIKLGDNYKQKNQDIVSKVEIYQENLLIAEKIHFQAKSFLTSYKKMKTIFPKLEEFASNFFKNTQTNNRTGYSSICEYLINKHSIEVKDVVPDENKPFTKQYDPNKKNLFYLIIYL